MDENKPQSAKWVLCVDIDTDNPESEPTFICKLDMPVEAFKDGLIGVTLAGNMSKATVLVARIACQAIDKALKRHIERGGYSDTPEMLTGLHLNPMGDIRDARP